MAFFTASRALPLAALLAAAAFTGCKKDKDPGTDQVPVPTAPDYILPRLPANAHSQLLSITHEFRFYRPNTVLSDDYASPYESVTYQTVLTRFSDKLGPQPVNNYVNAGAVKVNGIDLDKSSENVYTRTDNFNFNQGLVYDVAGNDSIAAFSYRAALPQPTYTGNIPTSIDRKLTLTVPLGGSNISGADSVIVVVRSGADKLVKKVSYLRPDATALPSVSFSTTELGSLHDALAESNTAFVQVMVFRSDLNPFPQGGPTATTGKPLRKYAITRESILTVPVRFFKTQ